MIVDLYFDPTKPVNEITLRIHAGAPPAAPPGLPANGLGLDISHWQSDNRAIDWPLLAEVGRPAFVYIKATDGPGVDSWLTIHRDGALGNGLPYGFYHYMRAQDGRAQADNFLSRLAGDLGVLPLAIDVEESDIKLIQVRAFADRLIERAPAQKIVIYTRATLWSEIGGDNPSLPEFKDCGLWVSHPNAARPILPSDWMVYDFWQINWRSRVPGIAGDVDVNMMAGPGPKPWFVRDFAIDPARPSAPPLYKARAVTPGDEIIFYKSPRGAEDRRQKIITAVDVFNITLDGWLKVSNSPPLWARNELFKV